MSVAIAGNFMAPAEEIAKAYEKKTGGHLVLSFGSTGQLYAQITQGAPYQVFLSADAPRAQRAEDEGWAVAGSRFTYAIGRLVLWSADPDMIGDTGPNILETNEFFHLAIANPDLAPYGAAAVDTMKALNVYDILRPKLVIGSNVLQTLQFVDTGNAELGFVALSQVLHKAKGSRWVVPDTLYTPIRQQAVVLKHGEGSAQVAKFIEFLKSNDAATITENYGYIRGSEDAS